MSTVAVAVCCLVSGVVRSESGAPLQGARVEARSSAAAVTTAPDGRFGLQIAPGSYRLSVTERGYAPVTITVDVRRDVDVRVSLEPLDSAKLREIGEVTVDGRLARVQGEIPSATITRSQFDALGEDRIVDGLEALPGATFARPDGGAASAITAVALRGPDPSESLVTLDGQLLNDGNTGDLDLSRLPVAAFSALDVTEGLGPEDANGSNTFGGAIDLISLRPTLVPHESASYDVGSFGQSEAWLNATGTRGRLGYAFALDDDNETGYVGQTVPLYSTTDPTCAPCSTYLGSSIASHLALANATWTFSPRSSITGRVFALGDVRDQSSALNGIDANAADLGTPQYGAFTGPGFQSFAQDLRAYQVRALAPLGAGELTLDLSTSDDGITIDGGSATPYDVTHVDHRYNAGATWQRTFADSQFAVGGYTRYESLAFLAPGSATGSAVTGFEAEPTLGQTIDVGFVRGGFTPLARLRLDAGAFYSNYTSFGSNLDGRFGAIYDAGANASIRFSVGTGFRAPLLIERYPFPYEQLTLDGNNVFIGQGSPNERPEHATEYELGASKSFGQTTIDASLYRTNLRDPIEIYYPLGAVASGACATNSYANPIPACVSYNSNVGNAVYEGLETRLSQAFPAEHLFLTARYGLNIAYPKDLNSDFSNPTSGGNLIDGAQFLGIPQQQGSLQLEYRVPEAWHAGAQAVFRGNNNELSLGPFTMLDAVVGHALGAHADFSLTGTNTLNAGAGRFTLFGAGAPYRGLAGPGTFGPLPTDAEFVEPFGLRAAVTLRT